MTEDSQKAEQYLSKYLEKTLRVQISDDRMFTGVMKCVDKDRNIILNNAHEFRKPSPSQLEEARAQRSRNDLLSAVFKPRFVGMIVVPGQHITKIEVEEFKPSGIV